ncbi:hypothetical protein FBEOM_11259 [Fusarium beomiforme]|uniref:Fe2OG dioxygenase domain-containing protein n=1 Tax=Fusarium beomiforme TaxID=44412 RepID=A0A9P5A9X1_9HYPO|nr:hypothetical protein FBEOM_11259 [Fusarium beomiforme]
MVATVSKIPATEAREGSWGLARSVSCLWPPKPIPSKTKRATRPTKPIPQYLIDEAAKTVRKPFDAETHLNYQPPTRIYTMAEIGLEGHGIAPNAVCEPFQLFTPEAVEQMRAEIFSEPVLRDFQYTSGFIKNMIRGMGPDIAPFIHTAWRSPELLAKVSAIAGTELIPAIDFDIGNVNVSINDAGENSVEHPNPVDQEKEASTSAVAWHYDSFPFVVVTMLSNCTGMIGGETALRLPNGETKVVRGPAQGTAVVMQGRYIEHQALKAFGGRERLAMVTSFRAKDPLSRDETVLTGVRGICNLSTLYHQYTECRLEILEERIRHFQKMERRREIAKRPYDIAAARRWLSEQKEFLEDMLEEIYEIGED